MADRPTRRMSLRATGMVVAIGVFLIAVGLLGLIAMWGGGGTPGPGAVKAPAMMPPTPTEITGDGLQNAGRARVQFTARDDPRRVIGYLEWASLEPTGPGRAVVQDPRADLFMRDGSTLQVRAATGSISYPAGSPQQAESGTFEGGVTIEITLPPAEAGGPVRVLARVFTPALTFSAPAGELAASGRFRASGPMFEFSGRGLRLVGNEVENRLQFAAIEHADYLWLVPGSEGSASPGVPKPAVRGLEPDGRSAWYHAIIAGGATMTRGRTQVQAPRMEAWAHLINNALPAGAMGSQETGGEPAPRADAQRRPGTPQPSAPAGERPVRSAAIPGEPASLFERLDDPELIRIGWGGAFTVMALEARPSELTGDEVAGSLRGEGPDRVRVDDANLRATVSADAIDYGVTSRRLSVRGAASGAELILAEKGTLRAEQAEVNLGTGVGVTRGKSMLIAGDSTLERARDIQWSRTGRFTFNTRDGWIGDRLTDATFEGDVSARDGASWMRADAARAVFATATHPDSPMEGYLQRLEARGAVQARDAGGGELAGDEVDVVMEPRGASADADPRTLAARGSVRASRQGWSIECDRLEAALERDERNAVVVREAAAAGSVVVDGPRVQARAGHLSADVQRRTLDLLGGSGEGGEPASITRDGGTIRAGQMRLDGNREELFAFGPGELHHDGSGTDGTDHPHATQVQWRKSMTFNNTDGRAECAGEVVAVSRTSAREVDTLKAERVLLAFTPGKTGDPLGLDDLADPQATAPAGPSATGENPARVLLRAEAIGAAAERDGGGPATIESRRFAAFGVADALPGAPGITIDGTRPLERLIYAEGERLVLDQEAGRVTIPSAGRLLVDDRRPTPYSDAPDPAGGPVPSELSGSRGTTLFSWKKDLAYTRANGHVILSEGVRILHREGPDKPVLAIDAASAEARLRTVAGGESASTPSPDDPAMLLVPGWHADLLSASCLGHVVATFDQRRLVADVLTFETGTSELTAAAADGKGPGAGGRVVFTEPGNPSAVVARKLIWNTATQKVRIVEPLPILVPR